MKLNERIDAFSKLGKYLRNIIDGEENLSFSSVLVIKKIEALRLLIDDTANFNRWFIPEYVSNMLNEIGKCLDKDSLEKWLAPYKKDIEACKTAKTIAVVMAGNIPAVGFNDFLTVLISGNNILAKLSSDDDKLLPAIAELLIAIAPEFENQIQFTDQTLKNFDAVIATGSNNSSRFFDYYFGKYPHIIRKNRNGVAIITGNESKADFEKLADDVFLYFGLGCRNVSKIFVPEKYDFQEMLPVLEERKSVIENTKYFNNYEYNKAIYLVNGIKHFDTGNLLLTENEQFSSPVSVLYFSYYDSSASLNDLKKKKKDKIQCVVGLENEFIQTIPFGTSQQPELWDYADGVDVMEFLLNEV